MPSLVPISGAPVSDIGGASARIVSNTVPAADPAPDSTPAPVVIGYPDPNIATVSPAIPVTLNHDTEPAWTVVVMLGGADVSSKITGEIRIDAREGEAKTAEFSIIPDSGVLDETTWMGAAVTIDYVGSVTQRMFTGSVDIPSMDIISGLASFSCNDRLPQKARSMTKTAIDAAVGGYFSNIVYSEDIDNWEYLKLRAATRPVSYDLDVNGVGQLSSWTPAVTPHYTFVGDDFKLNTLDYKLAQATELVNKINIDFDYRYQRKRQRERVFEWQMIEEYRFVAPDYNPINTDFPTLDMIKDAAEDKGGTMNINWRLYFPETGVYNGAIWTTSWDNREQLIPGINFTVATRFSQNITESYSLEIRAPQSQAQYGDLVQYASFGHETEFDAEGWETFDLYAAAPGSFATSPNGDKFEDANSSQADGRPAFDNAIRTIIAEKSTAIKSAARSNYTDGRALIQPAMERSHTVYFNTSEIQARGKVYSFSHRLNVGTGSATTDVRVALSKAINSAPVELAPQAPAIPASADAAITNNTTYLPTYLGADPASPPYDDSWLGYTGNFDGSAVGYDFNVGIVYPRRFYVPHQPVGAIDRSERNVSQSTAVDVAINNDLFVVTL